MIVISLCVEVFRHGWFMLIYLIIFNLFSFPKGLLPCFPNLETVVVDHSALLHTRMWHYSSHLAAHIKVLQSLHAAVHYTQFVEW